MDAHACLNLIFAYPLLRLMGVIADMCLYSERPLLCRCYLLSVNGVFLAFSSPVSYLKIVKVSVSQMYN